MKNSKDFAVLFSFNDSAFKFDSGECSLPTATDMVKLDEAIKDAVDWIKFNHVNSAVIFHEPTGCHISLYDLNGNKEQQIEIAEKLVEGFNEMTKIRAYYLAKNAGFPIGRELEFWTSAKQKLDENHPLRKGKKK